MDTVATIFLIVSIPIMCFGFTVLGAYLMWAKQNNANPIPKSGIIGLMSELPTFVQKQDEEESFWQK